MYATTFEKLKKEFPALDSALTKIQQDRPLSAEESRAAAAFYGTEAAENARDHYRGCGNSAARIAAHYGYKVINAEEKAEQYGSTIKSLALQGRIYSDQYDGERFTYAYRNRPFGYGHQPRGFIIDSYCSKPTSYGRWGTVQYPFRLTEQELYDFELQEVQNA